MHPTKTCGEFYQDALTEACGGDKSLVPVFAAGFVNGQAEKVYLGACRAAMFRPSDEWRAVVTNLARNCASRYGLLLCLTVPGEVWIVRPEAINEWRQMRDSPNNSRTWHTLRGLLCGIPAQGIDDNYHERGKYGWVCDKV